MISDSSVSAATAEPPTGRRISTGLAGKGIRFTHAYAQPLCTPTRAQLMTGQHNFRNWPRFGLMDPQEKTFGHMMQRAGYRTAIAGKWQFDSYEA